LHPCCVDADVATRNPCNPTYRTEHTESKSAQERSAYVE
jgi:hypothetical protein